MTRDNGLSPLSVSDFELETLLADRRLAQQIRFILEVERLKNVLRMTPLLDGSRRENDAEHSGSAAAASTCITLGVKAVKPSATRFLATDHAASRVYEVMMPPSWRRQRIGPSRAGRKST